CSRASWCSQEAEHRFSRGEVYVFPPGVAHVIYGGGESLSHFVTVPKEHAYHSEKTVAQAFWPVQNRLESLSHRFPISPEPLSGTLSARIGRSSHPVRGSPVLREGAPKGDPEGPLESRAKRIRTVVRHPALLDGHRQFLLVLSSQTRHRLRRTPHSKFSREKISDMLPVESDKFFCMGTEVMIEDHPAGRQGPGVHGSPRTGLQELRA
ncbi:MAG: hypothetical protein HYY93_10485, partial [Planctomycetes bacterium]|nr:hypothetical protein [Planctomycetota bacterium]